MKKQYITLTWTACALTGLLLFAQCNGNDAEGKNDTERHDGSDDNGPGTNYDDGDFDTGSDYEDDTVTHEPVTP